ncbi:hypothetical protein AAFF_G00263670 [Aldrovandia affinis]|uniref:Uncharacterized protein n=1 Tax=Aldrovandia affinis TaxID=143900 RepID=A0AAD7SSU5_9TELE|nr:hypothetical protein AAFF_G00263670 [Aldrovandia affinis]
MPGSQQRRRSVSRQAAVPVASREGQARNGLPVSPAHLAAPVSDDEVDECGQAGKMNECETTCLSVSLQAVACADRHLCWSLPVFLQTEFLPGNRPQALTQSAHQPGCFHYL